MVEGGGSHLGSSSCHCLHLFMFVGSRLRSCAFVCTCAHSFSFAGGGIHSWAVRLTYAFVHGRSGSFLSGLERLHSFLSVHVCSWVVMMLTRCGGGGPLVGGGGGGCSLWQLRGGGVGWLVVVNEGDE